MPINRFIGKPNLASRSPISWTLIFFPSIQLKLKLKLIEIEIETNWFQYTRNRNSEFELNYLNTFELQFRILIINQVLKRNQERKILNKSQQQFKKVGSWFWKTGESWLCVLRQWCRSNWVSWRISRIPICTMTISYPRFCLFEISKHIFPESYDVEF